MTAESAVAALGDLVVRVPPGLDARPITAVEYDSRKVAAGAAFVAVRGEKADGADFVPQALARGAALVVAERPPAGEVEVPWVQVREIGRASCRERV